MKQNAGKITERRCNRPQKAKLKYPKIIKNEHGNKKPTKKYNGP
jgi:hypothetical protein